MERAHGTPPAVSDRWEDVMADLEATAEEYRDEGYETLAIHTGDVTPLPDKLALDVLAPGNEYRELEALAESFELDEFEVYAAVEGEITFALIALVDDDRDEAVLCPVFYHHSVIEAFGEQVETVGSIQLQIRPLSDESRVTFTLEDTELLF